MSTFSNLKFLIVDDEPIICDILSDIFSAEGAQVHIASGGYQALELIQSNDFDVLISDVRMPEGDGRYLIQNIPSDKRSRMKVFLCSGFNDITEDELSEYKVCALFPKPFDIEAIFEAISSALKN